MVEINKAYVEVNDYGCEKSSSDESRYRVEVVLSGIRFVPECFGNEGCLPEVKAKQIAERISSEAGIEFRRNGRPISIKDGLTACLESF